MTGRAEHWHATADLIGLPGMPANAGRSITKHGDKRGWVKRLRLVGSGYEWLESSLPAATQAHFEQQRVAGAPDPAAEGADGPAPASARPVSDRDRAVADARLDVLATLDRWLDAERPRVLDEALYRFAELYNDGAVKIDDATLAAQPRVSRTRLLEWRKLRAGGWSALLPRRGGHNAGQGVIDTDPELRDAIVAQILARPGHINAAWYMQVLRLSFPADRLPAERTLSRWVTKFRAENARMISTIADPDRHRSKYQAAPGDAAAGITRLNQLWELDSTPADIICTDGRMAIVAGIDVATRMPDALVVSTSKAEAIAALLRRMILRRGVPETVRTDEGADYTSRHVRRALADLGVEHDVLPPYSPERKPFIERFMRTLSHGLFERLPGFSGHNVAEAQALRNRKSFAKRRGETDAEAFEVAMTSAELQAACDDWLANVYERAPHAGLNGRSPFEAAAGQPIRTIDDERVLDLLLAQPADGDPWRVIQKKGVKVDNAWHVPEGHDHGAVVGEGVFVKLDPADWGRVYLFDRGDRFLCSAVALEREGIDRDAVAAMWRAENKRIDAEVRAESRRLKREVRPESAIQQILDAGRAEAAQVVAFPPRATGHDSPGLTAARAAADAGDAAEIETPAFDPADLEFMRRLAAKDEAAQLAREREGEELRAIAREAMGGKRSVED